MDTEADHSDVTRLRARFSQAAMRQCLGPCGQMFPSNGPWNRICPTCARANSHRPECSAAIRFVRCPKPSPDDAS